MRHKTLFWAQVAFAAWPCTLRRHVLITSNDFTPSSYVGQSGGTVTLVWDQQTGRRRTLPVWRRIDGENFPSQAQALTPSPA